MSDKNEKQIARIIETLGTKEKAIAWLCAASNANCLAVHELWAYPSIAEHFGITRGDYYNDYDALTEEDKKYISDNWKPNTGSIEERLDRLYNDLQRESGSFKYFERDIFRLDGERVYFPQTIRHYKHHATMLSQLLGDIEKLLGER